MRFFYFYDDDTLRPPLSHTNGNLVGRKPLTISFSQKTGTGKKNGKTAAATRMGRLFAEKLWRQA